MPDQAEPDKEILIQSQRVGMRDIFDNYAIEMCDDQGRPKDWNNLTKQQYLGYKEIQNGVKNKGWMMYTSDKSGKLVLYTYENFVTCMEPHYIGHNEANMEVVNKAEDKLNLHTKNVAKMLSLGKNAGHNQQSRCQKALKVVDSGVPDLDGF